MAQNRDFLNIWVRPLDPVRKASEQAAALGGPRIKLGEPWSQLGGPQSQLGGPRSQLGGPQRQVGGPRGEILHDLKTIYACFFGLKC